MFSTPLLGMYKWTIKLQYEAKTGLFSVNSVIAQWEFMELDIELLHSTVIKKFNPEVFWAAIFRFQPWKFCSDHFYYYTHLHWVLDEACVLKQRPFNFSYFLGKKTE